jgi:two-component system response regulator AtoC
VGFDVDVSINGPVKHSPVIAFVSMDLPGFSTDLLDSAAFEGSIEVVMMSEDDNAVMISRCMSKGATYFFCKPFEPTFLEPLLRDVFEESTADSRVSADPSVTPVLDQFGQLRGSSKVMRKLYRVLRKVGHTHASVLIAGESGTGKELVARTLHDLSDVANGPYVAMNCAAIPKDLFESELFGHEKGSYSGADKQHRGFFERAKGGTLFLDELGEMPIALQAKLLRVLEVGAYRRVGGEKDIQSSARILAATNRSPEEAISDGVLREDLYYRVARFPIFLPPLRQRVGDIAGLAQFFLDELNEKDDSAITLSRQVLEDLESHRWPGNVRELRSVIEHAYVLADGEIERNHLPALTESSSVGRLRISVGQTVGDAERALIFATLEAHDEDKQAAADVLGLSLRTLYNRLSQYDADDEKESDPDRI